MPKAKKNVICHKTQYFVGGRKILCFMVRQPLLSDVFHFKTGLRSMDRSEAEGGKLLAT